MSQGRGDGGARWWARVTAVGTAKQEWGDRGTDGGAVKGPRPWEGATGGWRRCPVTADERERNGEKGKKRGLAAGL